MKLWDIKKFNLRVTYGHWLIFHLNDKKTIASTRYFAIRYILTWVRKDSSFYTNHRTIHTGFTVNHSPFTSSFFFQHICPEKYNTFHLTVHTFCLISICKKYSLYTFSNFDNMFGTTWYMLWHATSVYSANL
jgi:hypothetical protein